MIRTANNKKVYNLDFGLNKLTYYDGSFVFLINAIHKIHNGKISSNSSPNKFYHSKCNIKVQKIRHPSTWMPSVIGYVFDYFSTCTMTCDQ